MRQGWRCECVWPCFIIDNVSSVSNTSVVLLWILPLNRFKLKVTSPPFFVFGCDNRLLEEWIWKRNFLEDKTTMGTQWEVFCCQAWRLCCVFSFPEGPSCQMKCWLSLLWVALFMWCPIVLTLLSCRWMLAVISDVAQFPTPQCLKLPEIIFCNCGFSMRHDAK